MHPGILSMLADAFKEAAENTQIMITSHSPHLLDLFEPHQIHVVRLVDGETHLNPVKRTQVESIKEQLTSIKELMMLEGLQPEEEI